jgi:hypothetical protein
MIEKQAPMTPLTPAPGIGPTVELRHTLATLAYRASKALRGASPGFAEFRAGPGARSPAQILAHMGDLMDWALSMAKRAPAWQDSEPLAWDDEVARFFHVVTALDGYLAAGPPIEARHIERIYQGPIADALSHTGQLALLRRLANEPVRGENYARAEIVAGNTRLEQPAPNMEFD